MTSGDVDKDGRPEFFVKGEGGGGSHWILMYETDGDNQYSPKLLFHLLSGAWYPSYLIQDVDGDTRLEFVVLSGADFFIFKSSADNSYYLWFYKRVNAHNVQLHNFFGEKRSSLILSSAVVDSLGYIFFSVIYRPNPSVHVAELRNSMPQASEIVGTFPNPFNNSTTIEYALSNEENVSLEIYNTVGQLVTTLERGRMSAGIHRVVWGTTSVPSGVYFLTIQTSTARAARKLLLLR